MGYFYPQAVMSLKIRFEDFGATPELALPKSYDMIVVARNVTVSINSYAEADTFSAELDYNNFPFDPRCIRAIGVVIHIEDMKSLQTDDGDLNTIIPSKDNTAFIGFADEETIDFDEENRSVKFGGRDFTSLFIDAPYPGKSLSLAKPVDILFEELIAQLPSAIKITVDNRTGSSLPNLASFAPDFNKLSTDRSAKKGEFYWDVMQNIAAKAGLIIFIELDKLVITKPRHLYNKEKSYQFIYGENLKSLKFHRKIGRQRGLNIRVRSLNLETKTVIEADIPKEATQSWSQETGVARSEQTIEKIDSKGEVKKETAPYLVFRIADISNKNHLISIGEGIFEEIGRQQLEGELSTKEMIQDQFEDINLGKENTEDKKEIIEYDITKIRNGTAIKVEVAHKDILSIQRQQSEAEKVDYLMTRGYQADVAIALAKTLGKYETTFYTKSVEFTIDKDSGFEMKLDFINFIDLGNKAL